MRQRWVSFESPALSAADWEVHGLEGVDELNRLFRFDVQLVSRTSAALPQDLHELLKEPATLRFEDAGELVAQVHGIVAELDQRTDVEQETTHLRLRLVPRAWLMTERRGSEIFLGRTIPEILAAKLEAIGLGRDRDFVIALHDDYPAREIVVQYDETDHAFFSRLCEHHGIITRFEHRDGRDVLLLTDSQEAFRPLAGVAATIPMRTRREHPSAYDVKTTLRRLPSQALVRDYNYRSPRLQLDHTALVHRQVAAGDWVELGPHAKSPDEAERLGRIRAEEIGATHQIVEGKTTVLSLRAGVTVTVVDAGGAELELLLTAVSYHSHLSADASEGADRSWDTAFVAIPRDLPFRPARRTAKPKVAGLLNAVVDGAVKGPYAELDEAGRYHLSLYYDRSGRTDLRATHPVRMMQAHAGAHYGMHFPLRPGTEVLVACVNGDPDRPIIVGTAPNPVTASPVDRGNQTQNVLRTGSNNEMVIEDEHGIERIRIHTPHQNTTIQLGSVEEAEEGALTTTQANISAASRHSANEATTQRTALTQTTTDLVGNAAVLLAGLEGITRATERGIEQPGAVRLEEIDAGLRRLALPPGEEPEEDRPEDSEDSSSEASASTDDAGGGGGLWSSLGASLTQAGEAASMQALRAMARATDDYLASAQGRLQGQPLGEPLQPAVILGSLQSATLFSRDRTLLFGDQVAALSSDDTASVTGRQLAELRSPTSVEIAAGERIHVTTPGELDVAADTIRVVGGYYPEQEPPALGEGTSIGVMAREDLKLISVEHCILACAHKNVIATAHEGQMKLTAKEQVAITGGAIVCTGGSITATSSGDVAVQADGNLTIETGGDISATAGGTVSIEGAAVIIKGGSITLQGPVMVEGDLTVSGAISGG